MIERYRALEVRLQYKGDAGRSIGRCVQTMRCTVKDRVRLSLFY